MSKQEAAGSPNSCHRPRRRRGAALEQAILEAAWDVLVKVGYAGFTFEAIAERAETSRPVIYRRWPHRDGLLFAAIAEYRRANPIDMPDTGNLRDDAISFLRNANASRAVTTALIAAQLNACFRETGSSLDELRTFLRRGEATAFEMIMNRALERGEIAELPHSSRIMNLPFDLLRHDIHMTFSPISDESIIEIVDMLWLPLLNVSLAGGLRLSGANV